jgi:tRNA (adenine-N(1)-)-methyltransferase non-catalytic subunit
MDQKHDNRGLVDNNSSQTLSEEQIAAMKADGADGRQIIGALIDKSVSYQTKTEFSKAKYLKRKREK